MELMQPIPGFKYAGISLDGKKKNLAIIYSELPQTMGAAVYTRNDIKAAPVLVSQAMDEKSPIKRAILANSGTANAFTGKQGLADAEACTRKVALEMGIKSEECYIASTGVIGKPLPMESILSGITKIKEQASSEKFNDFSEAIMTTDTHPKRAYQAYSAGSQQIHLAGCVKGAGMIMPNMATMLCFVTTDACISQPMLKIALKTAVDETFNCITVDSDTSTNDTVFVLANGAAKNTLIKEQDADFKLFSDNLKQLLEQLAMALINDAEGITKFITIEVQQARDFTQARTIALSVANSPLVKTAFFGEQLNWGRIAMAIGKAQTGINPQRLDILVNGYIVVSQGEPLTDMVKYREAEKSLKQRDIFIQINLHAGQSNSKVWTCDFSLDYIKINANYIS